ncbi:MAG: hypothetical protein KJN98_02185 [Pontiella sp.]|nr:hypothetical protein [Pontiella sp.]
MADKRSFETTIHDVVYSVDTGSGLKVIRVALYILILLILVMIYTATQFRGLNSEEAMDYAQLGRNMSIQNGMLTKVVRPLTMWKMQTLTPGENPLIGAHPDMFNAPAYPALLATGFKAFDLLGADPFTMPEGVRGVAMPAEQWIILPLNHTFCLLSGLLVFFLGKRLFSHEIGFVSMTTYYLSNLVWQNSISGLNISMAGFFVLASFFCMITATMNRRDGSHKALWVTPYLLSIFSAAIAFYTRYITIAVVPGVCLLVWLMCGRFRGGTRFVVVFVILFTLLITPWLYRNYKVSGNPAGMVGYTALTETAAYPDNSLHRDYHPEVSFGRSTKVLKEKWVNNYSGTYSTVIPSMGGGILMGLFIATFFYHFVRPQVNHLRWGVGVSLLTTAGLAGFFSETSIQSIQVYWPFVIPYGIAFFYILIDRLDLGVRLYNLWLKILIVVLVFVPMFLTLAPPNNVRTYPPYHAPMIGRVGQMLNPREVLCTDMPWATAWYGDRVSILVPKDLEQFYEINDYKQYISGLYFTTITRNKPFVKQLLDGPERSWLPIMSGRTPPDFPLKEIVALNRQDQIFLSDRDRWSVGPAAGGVAPAQ